MFGLKRYADYEVGAGWIDPQRLSERLRGGIRLLCLSGEGRGRAWIGAVAWTLVLLSWWQNAPVRSVVADIVDKLLAIFH